MGNPLFRNAIWYMAIGLAVIALYGLWMWWGGG
jgi:hypothetical protein